MEAEEGSRGVDMYDVHGVLVASKSGWKLCGSKLLSSDDPSRTTMGA